MDQKSAEKGYNKALDKLTHFYETGIYKVYWCQEKAEDGDKNAQYNLGLCYKNGIGVEKNEIKAIEYFHKSAIQEDSNAQNELGIFYENGIEKDEHKAFYWYQKAAENENEFAQYNLGLCYENGIGVEKNESKAFNWYKKSAKQECCNAQNKLGSFYKYGIVVVVDEVKAFYWYQKSAKMGYKLAQYNLGLCYKYGIGIEKDDVKAFDWFKKSAEQGYGKAQKKLKDGIGITKDAFIMYLKAAENENTRIAQHNLGLCYKEGIGTKNDNVKAFEWIKKSAEQEYSSAQNELGIFYENGTATNATKWIKNALKYKQVKFIPYNDLESAEFVNEGGFGIITKAIWTKIHDYVICKKLTNTINIKHDILDAFIHELKMHLQLGYSDRIIHCLGISIDPTTNKYLLIMQYADGGDLQNYLKTNFKNLTWDDKKKLAFQIADGLNYLHNEDVLHRDLHSKNIVIHENNAKITDFGISKIQNDQNSTVYMGHFGVIPYMEPKHSDDKVSLGFTINNGTREITIPGTPIEYENLYKNCWNKEPGQRPVIYEILNEFKRMNIGIESIKEIGLDSQDKNLDDLCILTEQMDNFNE
ncbi:kinase-like domain-containing protein [Rhizophagus irregularis DAOM 181602=DAOM 197198]|nr:kinase-like domain-containing protein [Rhizophagus irregularis DAOM 181602=DAOM 197198]